MASCPKKLAQIKGLCVMNIPIFCFGDTMRIRALQSIITTIIVIIVGSVSALGQPPVVISTSPPQNAINVYRATNISATFDIPMDTQSFTNVSFVVFANCTGIHVGDFSFSDNNQTATLDPYGIFVAGEVVTAVLTVELISSVGQPMQESFVWSFTIDTDRGLGHIIQDAEYPLGVGATPTSVIAADLDSDGALDLVSANFSANSITILMNNGWGDFSLGETPPVGNLPISVVAFDIDNDLYLDLAVANWGSSDVVIFQNLGGTGFIPHETLMVGLNPSEISAGDVDGNGFVDLITANHGSGDVSVIRNMGPDGFLPAVNFPSGPFPRSVKSADMDNDGRLDLVTANSGSASVSILQNIGDAIFVPFGEFFVGNVPWSVYVANLDKNEMLDIATADSASHTVSVILREPGSFSDAFYPVGQSPLSVFASDIDGDNSLDLMTANHDDSKVSVLLNIGDGTYAPHKEYSTGENPMAVYAVDLDSDMDIDLATANSTGSSVSVISPKPLILVSYGPVNMLVTDASGLRFGYDENGNFISEISPADYSELTDKDSITIFEPPPGGYLVTYSTEPVPKNGDKILIETYSAIIKVDGTLNATTVANQDATAKRRILFNYEYAIAEGYHYPNGDANRDDQVNVADAVFMINYVFKGGVPPEPVLAGDANCDTQDNIGDAVYIINYVFKGGPPPGYFEY
jgi:hypothetical protein